MSDTKRPSAKYVCGHTKDCHQSNSTRPRPFHERWWFPGTYEWRDAMGRRKPAGRSGYRWLVLKCNSTNCEARVVVEEVALCRAALFMAGLPRRPLRGKR